MNRPVRRETWVGGNDNFAAGMRKQDTPESRGSIRPASRGSIRESMALASRRESYSPVVAVTRRQTFVPQTIIQIPRHIENRYDSIGDIDTYYKLKIRIQSFLKQASEILVNYLDSEIRGSVDDFSLYTGVIGVLMTLKRLSTVVDSIEIPVISDLRVFRRHPIGLCSNSALYMYMCLQNNRPYDIKKSEYTSADTEDELLYGRAGHAVMVNYFASKGMQLHRPDLVTDILSTINIGQFPWSWHGKVYYGAAHGTAGILHALGRLGGIPMEEHIERLVKMSRIELSGNFRSSSDSAEDELVQWCHGAPGFVPILLDSGGSALDQALDVIWKRGMLIKGHGICHGTAGNGYAFLRAYQKTRDEHRLFQALAFADFIVGASAAEACPQADHPCSLFEGLSGTVHFLLDMLKIVEQGPDWDTFPLFDGLLIF